MRRINRERGDTCTKKEGEKHNRKGGKRGITNKEGKT